MSCCLSNSVFGGHAVPCAAVRKASAVLKDQLASRLHRFCRAQQTVVGFVLAIRTQYPFVENPDFLLGTHDWICTDINASVCSCDVLVLGVVRAALGVDEVSRWRAVVRQNKLE